VTWLFVWLRTGLGVMRALPAPAKGRKTLGPAPWSSPDKRLPPN